MLILMLEYCLAVSIAAALYPLALYPLILLAITTFRARPVQRRAFTPTVTVLIPAYDEADCIGSTIENKLTQDYPRDRLQIIVVSDASDDGTDAIAAGYADRGVELIRTAMRGGKAAALNQAVARARGEILVFSDANSRFEPDTVRRLVENFADPRVGYVTGCLQYLHTGETSGRGDGAYMRYENWLRRIESKVDSIIGVNGGVDAVRRELYSDVPPEQITDLVLPLRVIAAGMRVVYDERARSSEHANTELGSEFRMRVRVALRALYGLAYERRALNFLRAPLPAFCIVSHKVLRYAGFAFLGAALLLNAALAVHSSLFAALLALQAAFYALAILGTSQRLPQRLRRLTALPTYFLISTVAFGIATMRFLRGDMVATWRPRAG